MVNGVGSLVQEDSSRGQSELKQDVQGESTARELVGEVGCPWECSGH